MESKKFWNMNTLRISLVFNVILLLNVIVLGFMYMSKTNELSTLLNESNTKVESLTAELESNKIDYQVDIEQRDKDMEMLKSEYEELYNVSKQVNETNKELLGEIEQLDADNVAILEENEKLSDMVNVYEEYKVFMYRDDYSGRRTDCSYELLTYLDNLIEGHCIDNLAFYCSWIMIESTWTNHDYNPRSTAYGLPQFLSSTGRWIYEGELGYGPGTYDHEMVTDPYVSLPMMVKYLDILCSSYEGDLRKVIDSYRGLHDVPYLNKFDRYLAMFDMSIDSYAIEVKANYIESLKPVG